MSKEIRLYVEGGGDSAEGKGKLRQGLHAFLAPIVEKCREKRIRWTIVAAGSRNSTYDAFTNALDKLKDAASFLLVDAEEPVDAERGVWHHLAHKQEARWKTSKDLEGRYHLMVVMMESWLLADPDTLERFYDKGFRRGALPATRNIEGVPKADVARALKDATIGSQKKGEYHKLRHGPDLLGRIDRTLVRRASPHCDRLFRVLEEEISKA